MHDSVAQGADGYAGVVGQAEVHAAASALDEDGQIGCGLCFRQGSQAFRLDVVQRNVFELVGGDEQEDAVVRAALLQLTGRVQVARADFQARCNAKFVGNAVADGLERFAAAFAVKRQKGVQGEVIARLSSEENSV